MIDFQNKQGFRGLFDAIATAGHSVCLFDGVWQVSDEVAVQAIINGYTLDDARDERCAKVDQHAKKLFDQAVAGVSAAEMAGWPLLAEQAKLYNVAQDESVAPAIVTEASFRGVEVQVLVDKVLEKAQLFNLLRAAIAGVSGKHRDAIKALDTFDDILNYDYSTDWPEV